MNKKYLKKILELFSDYKRSVAFILIYIIILMAVNYCLPFFSRKLIDEGFIAADKNCIISSALIILALNTVSILISILRRREAVKMNLSVRAKMQKEVFRHLLGVKISYFSDKNATSTFQCIDEDINNISSLVNDSTISAVTAIFSAIAGGVALFTIDWHLGLAVVLFTPLNILCSELFSKKNHEYIRKALTQRRNYSSWYGETINGVREIRLFGIQNRKTAQMEEMLEDITQTSSKCHMLLTYNAQTQAFLTEVLKALIYLLSAYFMIKSNLTVGSVVAFQAYMLMVSGSEAMIIGMVFSVISLLPHIRRYYDFIDEPEENSAEEDIEFNDGAIEFRNVSFAYNETDDRIFSDINISIPCGSKNVIVGDNGAGKTTFLNLLLSLIEPVSGDIMISGKTITDVNLEAYRKLFSVVSQDIFLFHDTLRNNICLGSEVSDEELADIISDVNLDRFVEQNGLDHQIEFGGSNLSGGQKQKIALARALVMKRPILLFDEATANLDRISIKSFIDLFDSKLKDTTVICVSHSDEIIDHFDSRIVISDGNAVMEKSAFLSSISKEKDAV